MTVNFLHKILFIVILSLSFTSRVISQEATNSVFGTVKDSINGGVISSATATIYIGNDSTILKYGFTNNSGKFLFKTLPYDTLMYMIISHVSYREFVRYFKLTKTEPELDLGIIKLFEKSKTLEEVNISHKKPPVFMNGDTLVIEPSAFKTKENAVVEDVLRKVPGIVVWSDGKISVNGKNVTQLLVGGKPFFGGDPVVAIRNLPNQAIDKIKVYENNSDASQFENDRKLTMDITLKKDVTGGYFGKAGIAGGTDRHYDGSVTMNTFSQKNQITVMAVGNDINKEIFDVKGMLKQTVYKPGGNDNTNYQSDFSKQGLNGFSAAGFNFDRDWSKSVNTRAEYFNYKNDNELISQINQITTLGSSRLDMRTNEKNNLSRHRQHSRSAFKDIKENYKLRIEPSYEIEKNKENRTNQILTERNDIFVSEGTNLNNTNSDIHRWKVLAEYEANGTGRYRYAQAYLFRYNLNSERTEMDELLNNNFTDYIDSSDRSIKINRERNLLRNYTEQSLYGEMNLNSLFDLTGRYRYKFQNIVSNIIDKTNQQVEELDPFANEYNLKDPYLSNRSDYNLLQERPGIEISTSRRITGVRNYKLFSLTGLAEVQYLNQNNNSQKQFQQIHRNYFTLLPSLSFNFNHVKDGQFNDTYRFKYTTSTDVPSIDQLAPLLDNANLYFLKFGNNELKKQYSHEISLYFQRFKPGDAGNLRLDIRMGSTEDKLVDSSIYEADGRRNSYTANADGFRYLSASLSFEKSGRLFRNPIGLALFPRLNFSNNPYYIDGKLLKSKNSGFSMFAMVNYVQNDLLLYDFSSNIMFYRNILDDQKISSAYMSTGGSVQLSWPKRTTIVNYFSYDVITNSYSRRIENFIWNTSVYLRLLKQEQLELKFTAADLLRQRTNVISYIDNNVLRNGSVNNLRQFFLVGISYYPRQFGKKKKR